MNVTLKILAEDIVKNNYLSSDNCPITKALKRAGYSNLIDSGISIVNEYRRAVITINDPVYDALGSRVIKESYLSGSHLSDFTPKDFEVTLNLDI